MSKMHYPKTAAALSTALRRQKPEPPDNPPPSKPAPGEPWRIIPLDQQPVMPPPPPPEPPTLTYEPHPEHSFRVHAYLGGRWLGDLVAFPRGYRAYLRDDTPVPGLWVDRETAARALEVGR